MRPLTPQASIQFELGVYEAADVNQVQNVTEVKSIRIYHPVLVWAS